MADDLDASTGPVVAPQEVRPQAIVPAHLVVEREAAGAFAREGVGG